ncbi:MAG: hypothetical protein L3J25_11025 [Flavobacteriaceae bacterium]|nr:hypothetical protein [Flavobacteriaceae bacterium]
MKKLIALLVFTSISFSGFSQEDTEGQRSVIQEYTPSKLLKKGQWDIKFFNSLYTQTKITDAGSNSVSIPRETFFTNTTEIYTGISKNSRVNIGFIFQVRSNTFGGADAINVFKFEDNGSARSGLTTIAPSIRVQPFANTPNFSFTSSVYLPVFRDKANAPYLDKRSVFWETKFFYDKTFGDDKWQVFTEVDLGFNFGEKSTDANANSNVAERFANNSLFMPFGIFLSYFPSAKTTVFVNTKQVFLIDLGNDFSQNYTSLGFGGKHQLTRVLNIEVSFDKFVRGHSFQGLGQTFSLGLRALF